MSSISPSSVSSRITTPLQQVATRQWTVLAARGLVQTLVISLAILLVIASFLGKFEGMFVWARVILAALAWGTIICTGIFCLRPALQRWSLSRAAQVADEALPDTQERISSALELSQTTDRFRGSPELVAHLIRQAENDASRVQATAVIPFRSVFIWAAVFVPVIALWAGMMLFFPGMVERGLFYSVMPMRPAPAILSTVAIHPGEDQVVFEGDSLDFSASVNVMDRKFAKRAELVQTFDATGKSVRVPLTQDENKGTLFARKLENLTQSFKYTVSTDRGDSVVSYHVTVIPRPKIQSVDVTYNYPAYLNKPTEVKHDLNISAVVGTKVTIAVHTTDLQGSAASQIVINDGPKNASNVALTPAGNNVLTAKLDVTETPDQERAKQTVEKTYTVNLTSAVTLKDKTYNPANKDVPHTLTAIADQIPTIKIIAPNDLIKVRPDDDVTVTYQANDDFGVVRVELLVSIDDKPDHIIPIAIPATANHRDFKQNWVLSIPAMMKLEGVAQADHVTFQLQAFDAYPAAAAVEMNHPAGRSDRRTISIIQNQKESYQQHLNEIAKLKLEEAIQKAIRELTVEAAQVATVRDAMARGTLPTYHAELARKEASHVGRTGTDLAASASEFVETPPFAEMAKEAQKIADNEIKKAAADTTSIVEAKTKASAQTSYDEIIDSRDKLQKLLEQLKKKAEALEALNEAKKLQDEVAKAMAEHPENKEENLKKQQEAIAKLQEAIKKDAIPQDPKAVEQAKQLAELQNQIKQDQQKQADLQNQTAKQEEQQQAQQAANALAEEQKKLNEEVKEFAKAEKKALDQAKAATPDQQQQQQLVKNIEQNQLEKAAQQAQQAADQLNQDAKKLDQQAQAAANPKAATPEQQAQQQQDKQNQANAAAAEKQADQAAAAENKEAAQEQKNADAAKAAEQAVEKAAEAIAKQADKIEKDNAAGAKNPAVDKAAEAAKADAKDAVKDAQAAEKAATPQEAQADAAKAAQELAKAGQELAQAAQAEKQNQQAAAQAQKQADQAAKAENAAAQQQQQNADAAKQAEKNVEKAAAQIAQQAQAVEDQNKKGANDPQVNQAAEAAKADAAEAAKDAQAAEKAAEANNAQEAQKDAADAAKALAKAGQELAQAAQAEAKADAAQAQAQNKDAAAQAAQAGEEAKALAEKQQAIAQALQQQAQQQADAQKNAATPQQAAQQQEALAQQTQQAQKAAEQLAQQAQQAQNPNLAQRAEQAAKALDQAAQAQQDAAKADAAGKPADAAQDQANAQQALAKADQALRGDPAAAQADAAQAQGEQGKPDAAQGQPEAGKPEAGQGKPEAGQGKPEAGQGQPQQTAAQAAAEAAQAQQQALQPNPAAAAEAAQALAQAAQAAQQGPPGPPEAGNEPGHEPGDHPGQETNTTPHDANDPHQGITGTDTGGDNKVPESVKKMGITSSDWAKLSKTQKFELENRSREPMNPAYAEQIGTYFLRQARIDKEHAPAGK